MEKISENQCFGGRQLQYSHESAALNCTMRFSVFLPPQAEHGDVPVLYWLSGLTCTDQNFVTKAGAQRYAAEAGIAIVAPDTSPRGESVPDDPDSAYDFGLGAGFYVNATQAPWNQHYKMYDYVVEELPKLVCDELPLSADRAAISGHSMGGHGAMIIALRNSDKYRSVSAFSPICSPMNCPWGEKALGNYLGDNRDDWRQYDAVELIRSSGLNIPLLVDQGTDDDFLQEQLKTPLLIEATEVANTPVAINLRQGYDHSYFFIASFISEHIQFHNKYLGIR